MAEERKEEDSAGGGASSLLPLMTAATTELPESLVGDVPALAMVVMDRVLFTLSPLRLPPL